MTRAELIHMFVLDSMCDDYEDIERITDWAVESGSRCGLTISHDDIIQALRELIDMGRIKAWDLTKWPEVATPGYEISPLNPRFARTDDGLAFWKISAANGPFDEDHNLRQSWLASETSPRRNELIRLFIISYRSCTHILLAHIERDWKRIALQYGIEISRDEFTQALRELVDLGYLKAAYRDEYWQYTGMPPLDDIKPYGAYFWVTGDGFDFHEASRRLWPFDEDDDGEFTLREGWVPPDA
jgi:hypothetical protein